jgi:SAM-dependent methyltransferase
MNNDYPQRVAQIYDQCMSEYDYEKAAFLISKIINDNNLPDSRLLEIGVGTGLLAEKLNRNGWKIEGLDRSMEMLKKCRERIPEMNLYHQNILNFGKEKKFDCIVSHAGPLRMDYTKEKGCFLETYLTDRIQLEKAISSISKSLTEKGIFILSIQHPAICTKELSAPSLKKFKNGYVATTEIIEEAGERIKIRRFINPQNKVLLEVRHSFFVFKLCQLEKIFKKHNFGELIFDKSGKFCYVIKNDYGNNNN